MPLEPTHKRRPARGQGEPGQHSRLQTGLLEAIFSSTNLEAAYGRVKANDGAAGVDGVSLAEIYTDMRQQDLELDAEKIGELKDKPVWAVLMETGYPEAAVTLVAVADGAASLYFSNGGGIIGAGEHANVRPASLGLVTMVEGFLPQMTKVDKFPVPKPGRFLSGASPDVSKE